MSVTAECLVGVLSFYQRVGVLDYAESILCQEEITSCNSVEY